jgi:hypothetical protein
MKDKFSSSTTDTSTRFPSGEGGGSYLADESFLMEQEQRATAQQGHRQYAKVNVVEHTEPRQSAQEGEYQNNIKQNPYLDSQRFDGTDPNESQVPALNTEARTEYDNALREQHQLKHSLMPKMGTAPEPKPG